MSCMYCMCAYCKQTKTNQSNKTAGRTVRTVLPDASSYSYCSTVDKTERQSRRYSTIIIYIYISYVGANSSV